MILKIIVGIIILALLGGGGYLYLELNKTTAEVQQLKDTADKADKAKEEVVQQLAHNQEALAELQTKYDAEVAKNQPPQASTFKFSSEMMSKTNTDYKIVRLTDKKIYYGRITGYTGGTVKLIDIFYIQGFVDFTSQESVSGNPQLSLVKYGLELDGGKEPLLINDSSIISIEKLSTTSKVYQAITEYHKVNP